LEKGRRAGRKWGPRFFHDTAMPHEDSTGAQAADCVPGASDKTSANKPTVIFVCSGNSARSVAAEHLANKYWSDRANFMSAGTNVRRSRPKEGVITALKDGAMIELPDDLQCRTLFDVLDQQFPKDPGESLVCCTSGRLAAVIVLCCKALEDCPNIEERLPQDCTLIKEILKGPMEMMDGVHGAGAGFCSLEGGCDSVLHATKVDKGLFCRTDAEAAVFSEFVSNMDGWVKSALPAIIPSVLALPDAVHAV
jgi:hypothetical protein